MNTNCLRSGGVLEAQRDHRGGFAPARRADRVGVDSGHADRRRASCSSRVDAELGDHPEQQLGGLPSASRVAPGTAHPRRQQLDLPGASPATPANGAHSPARRALAPSSSPPPARPPWPLRRYRPSSLVGSAPAARQPGTARKWLTSGNAPTRWLTSSKPAQQSPRPDRPACCCPSWPSRVSIPPRPIPSSYTGSIEDREPGRRVVHIEPEAHAEADRIARELAGPGSSCPAPCCIARRCGKPSCRCHADPPSRIRRSTADPQVNGKTVTRHTPTSYATTNPSTTPDGSALTTDLTSPCGSATPRGAKAAEAKAIPSMCWRG